MSPCAKSITHDQLELAEIGFYSMPDVLRFTQWDLIRGKHVYADWRLHCRVLNKNYIPDGLDVVVRRDGAPVLKQWLIEKLIKEFDTREEADAYASGSLQVA